MQNRTTDLWFAGYLKLQNIEPVDFITRERNKGEFIYDLSDEQWKQIKMEFECSDQKKMKYAIESLKDLIFN